MTEPDAGAQEKLGKYNHRHSCEVDLLTADRF